jgi:hypothetical protein
MFSNVARESSSRAIAHRWFEVMRKCGDEVRELLHDSYPVVCLGARGMDVNGLCPQPSLHAQSGSVSIAGGSLPQQVHCVFGGDGKVRAAKPPEHREIYADHFSLAVEERSARPPGGCGPSSTILSSSTSPISPCVVVGRMRRRAASCDMIRLTS